MSRQHGETTTMKTLYIFLTRSGTLLSNLVYSLTGAQYTHISLAFDEDLSTLYSSTRKNGYTMFPAGPSREYLNRGVFLMRENIPCALYALEVTDEAYTRAKRRTQHMMHHGEIYRFNSLGLLLCWMHVRWQRRRHYFCSQFVSEVLQKSGALELPKPSTLMHPSDYAELPELRCLYRGTLAGLPQRQSMELGEVESVMGLHRPDTSGKLSSAKRTPQKDDEKKYRCVFSCIPLYINWGRNQPAGRFSSGKSNKSY